MKHIAFFAALAMGVTLTSTAFANGSLSGIWRTATYNGEYAHVRFGPCGGKTCGVVVGTFDKAGEIQGGSLGKTIVINMEEVGQGAYENGRIRRPDTGQSAPLKLELQGNSMNVRACIGPLCRNETWSRVK
ncbi:MAG TPA: DUF2147 domain-containing protein [Maritimibacter sp.]|nr:DUF2147 domain-containing protein [Maritimibacter sp.]